MFIYGGMAVTYGLIGSILGVLLSLPAASWMAQQLAPLALTYIADFRVSSAGVIIGLLMGVLVPLLASALPVFNGTRVSILEAMTDLGISSNWGKSRLSRFIGALPVPMTIRQALSNVAQKRGRLALTGLTLTLAAAVFMGVTAVFTSLGDTVESIFDTFNYEIVMTPQTAQDFDATHDLILSASDQFTTVYPGYGVSAVIEGYESTDPISEGSNSLFVSGVDPASPVIQFDLEQGTGWESDPTRSGIIITRTLADNVEKSVGDTLVLRVGGAPREYEIIGIDSFSFDTVYMDWRELATFAGFTDESGAPLPGQFYIDAAGEPDAAAVDELIDQLDALMLNNGVQAVFVNQPAEADTFAQQLNLFSLIFNLTSGIMAAVGAIGLLAALSMAVFERQKEIGVMRSIGASSGAIVTQFLVEGILVGFIAWAVAVPLSYLIGSALADQIGFGTFSFTYPPQVLVLGFTGILIIATIASIWPSLSAARKTVSDILRYQ
jgi:putative ABC transport system permease protein